MVPALSRLNSETETGGRSGSGRNSVSSSGSGNKTVAAEGPYEVSLMSSFLGLKQVERYGGFW